MVYYAERIERALKHAQLTPKDLQDHLGVSYQAMKKLMNGISKSLSAENHVRAARFLGVNSFWLATGEEEMISSSNYTRSNGEAVKLIARENTQNSMAAWPFKKISLDDFDNLNQHQRELIEAYARGLIDESAKKKSA